MISGDSSFEPEAVEDVPGGHADGIGFRGGTRPVPHPAERQRIDRQHRRRDRLPAVRTPGVPPAPGAEAYFLFEEAKAIIDRLDSADRRTRRVDNDTGSPTAIRARRGFHCRIARRARVDRRLPYSMIRIAAIGGHDVPD